MIEGSPDDGNFLVRVRAQVMTRDDATGGWVPLGGGGLSNVSVRKRVISDEENRPEYVIYGKRISDQTIILSCSIKRDFQYNIVMPTFHHWKTGDKKYGLTFQTAADGRAFDKGVRSAIEDLLEEDDHNNRRPGARGKVFVAVELPPPGSSSESANGTNRSTSATSSILGDTHSVNSSPYSHSHLNQQLGLQSSGNVLRPSRTIPGVGGTSSGPTLVSSISAGAGDLRRAQEDIWVKDHLKDSNPPSDSEKIELASLGGYPYVQFAKDRPQGRPEHEYSYPSMDTLKLKQDPSSRKNLSAEPPLLPSKMKGPDKESRRQSSPTQLRCRHCLEDYTEEENRPGSCPYGHDRTLNCIKTASCICVTESIFYHCMSDEEGHYHPNLCSCDTSDNHCRKRWTGLALLSFLVPCIWCYLPLRACHRCGVGCGYCGGTHEP